MMKPNLSRTEFTTEEDTIRSSCYTTPSHNLSCSLFYCPLSTNVHLIFTPQPNPTHSLTKHLPQIHPQDTPSNDKTSIPPNLTHTKSHSHLLSLTHLPLPPTDQKDHQGILDRIPLKRFGTPDEVADAVLFLTRNRYASGCILNLDGGLGAT